MTAIQTDLGSHTLVLLASTAARSLALAAIAVLALRALRVKSTDARLFTWTAVLYGSLGIPLLSLLLPSIPLPAPSFVQKIPLPVATLSPEKEIRIVSEGPGRPTEIGSQHGNLARSASAESEMSASQPRQVLGPVESHPLSWTTLAMALYLPVAMFLLARIGVGLAFTRRLVRRARPIEDARLRLGMPYRGSYRSLFPDVRESEAISVPVTVGPVRSTILLPPDWRLWDSEKLEAVLAHEMSHVSRHDAFSQCIALLHRAIFWFSPFSWWLNLHLAELAEQASDEAALSQGADRDRYARTLLGFFQSLQATPRCAWWQGVSMAKSGQAEKRLEKILTWRGALSMRSKTLPVVIFGIAIPVILVAASARPVGQSPSPSPASATKNQVSPAPTGTQMTPPTSSAAPAKVPVPPTPQDGETDGAPVDPVIPTGPGPGPVDGVGGGPEAMEPTDVVRTHSKHSGYWYSYGFDDEQRFVIVTGNSDALTMSGSSEDARHVEKLRKQIPGDFIWFQRDEKSYIIRDQATVDRARKLWAPQEELGKKQEALGRQQEALGKQQEELGAKMQQVKVNVPDMTAELDRLKAKLLKLGPTATMEQIGELQSEIGELQSKIGELQSRAGDQQGKLGEQMGALGEKQGKLGEQQGELGRQQAEVAEKATRAMKELLDESIKNGTAKPEPGDGSASL